MHSDVDLILLTFGQPSLTADALQSFVRRHDAASGPRVALIWVDNGSAPSDRDRTRHAIFSNGFAFSPGKGHPLRTTIERPENAGFPIAMNDAIAASKADFVVLANNDIVFHNAALSIMLRAMHADPSLGIVNPMSTNRSRPDIETDLSGKIPQELTDLILTEREPWRRGALLAEHCREVVYRCDLVSFFCTMIRRRVFDDLGWLDERYGMGWGEDDQFCERARKAGWGIGVAVGAFVEHVHRGTWNRILNRQQLYDRFMHAQDRTAQWRAAGEPVRIERTGLENPYLPREYRARLEPLPSPLR